MELISRVSLVVDAPRSFGYRLTSAVWVAGSVAPVEIDTYDHLDLEELQQVADALLTLRRPGQALGTEFEQLTFDDLGEGEPGGRAHAAAPLDVERVVDPAVRDVS